MNKGAISGWGVIDWSVYPNSTCSYSLRIAVKAILLIDLSGKAHAGALFWSVCFSITPVHLSRLPKQRDIVCPMVSRPVRVTVP
jgi:hypothetical protein